MMIAEAHIHRSLEDSVFTVLDTPFSEVVSVKPLSFESLLLNSCRISSQYS